MPNPSQHEILVVDDDAGIRKSLIIRRFLPNLCSGYPTIALRSAAQATASRCGFSLRMWRLSWRVQMRG